MGWSRIPGLSDPRTSPTTPHNVTDTILLYPFPLLHELTKEKAAAHSQAFPLSKCM
jgi:hypothetical protein